MKCLTKDGVKEITDWQLIKPYSNFKGWNCYPENQIVIDFYDKTIRNTVCLANKNQSFENYKPVKHLICSYENCFCATDIQLKKNKSEIYHDMLNDYDISGEYNEHELLAIEGKNTFHIEAYLEKKCNFTCSYCKDYKRNFKGDPLSLEYLCEVYSKFVPKNIKKTMTISGGEPTLQPYYLNWLTWLIDNDNIEIRTLTNGTRQVPYLLKLNELSLITISLHFEFINERYINKCLKFLKQRNEKSKHVILKAMFMRDKINEIENVMITFKEYIIKNKIKNVGLKLVPLWDGNNKQNLYSYDDNDFDFIKKYTLNF